MGFPWKKGAKSTNRISQMVKDQIHHRKTAASPLVVETGFPTSLVDLIVNHRDRFKKPNNSARSRKRKPPPPLTTAPLFRNGGDGGETISVPPPQPLIPAVTSTPDNDVSGGVGVGADSNKVLVSVLMIFLVIVLALGAKKFAIVITMSTFLLFFIDYLSRTVFKCECFIPFSEAYRFSRLILSRVFRLEDEVPVFKAPLQRDEFVERLDCSNDTIEEIQIVEVDDSSSCGRIPKPKSVAELIEEDEELEHSVSKGGKSRRAKIKSKMKKLFPKSSRKTGKDSKVEINPTRELKFSEVEENEETEWHERESELDNVATNVTSPELSEGVVESQLVENEDKYGFLVLILVALVGLVLGGRVYSLLFTLTWCFLSKSGETIKRCFKVT